MLFDIVTENVIDALFDDLNDLQVDLIKCRGRELQTEEDISMGQLEGIHERDHIRKLLKEKNVGTYSM